MLLLLVVPDNPLRDIVSSESFHRRLHLQKRPLRQKYSFVVTCPLTLYNNEQQSLMGSPKVLSRHQQQQGRQRFLHIELYRSTTTFDIDTNTTWNKLLISSYLWFTHHHVLLFYICQVSRIANTEEHIQQNEMFVFVKRKMDFQVLL